MAKGLEERVEERVEEVAYEIKEGEAPQSTDTNLRYAAYANRLRTIVLATQRYVAYTSDIGESFRPIVNPSFVRACYGISWAYVLGDVSYEGYKTYLKQEEWVAAAAKGEASTSEKPNWALTALQRGVFQSIASMGLPAFTIHSTVRYSGRAMRNLKNPAMRTWGPVGMGLAVVPMLPYLFDEPVEHAVEYVFDKGKEAYKDFNKKEL
ncbi:mitochondrial 18 KDa protein-domain-containing protein [Kockiozyma suomiensis]|uniref:mitochondrial 18 KDa protein-domain-containing protein n=1 Tax=Kockiozyma suomiensis TaxID=1337062 RepID=UPI0033430AA0